MQDTNKSLSIAFLTALDAQDKRPWSGVLYYVAQALQRHCGEVSYIGPIHTIEELLGKVINKVSQTLFKQTFPYYISFLVSKKLAKVASQKLAQSSFDVIVAPAGAAITAFLKTEIPIVLVEDTTFALLHDYYPHYSNLSSKSTYEANMIMRKAFDNSSLLIFSSALAARSAIEDYYADEQKVHVIPFGANFDEIPPANFAQTKSKSKQCKLLFVGFNWQKKGGDIAFETLLKLEELGIMAELTVCGCTPPREYSHPRMRVISALDKTNKQQHKMLEQLYMDSDFLLLPSRYDTSPIVFCEANAFGLPVITSLTGGIPEIVRNGENGFVLPYDARGTEYAKVIANYQDEQKYKELVKSSRAAFENRLNWDSWGVKVKKLIDEMLASRFELDSTYNKEANSDTATS